MGWIWTVPRWVWVGLVVLALGASLAWTVTITRRQQATIKTLQQLVAQDARAVADLERARGLEAAGRLRAEAELDQARRAIAERRRQADAELAATTEQLAGVELRVDQAAGDATLLAGEVEAAFGTGAP